jgi:predicted amidohydrolase YtcJ
VHAIGDEAIDTLLTLMEATMRENGARERVASASSTRR